MTTTLRRTNPHKYSPDSDYTHLLIEMIYRAKKFFKAKLYDISELNMHIPLPVQAVLVHAMDGFNVITPDNNPAGNVYIFGIKCLPAYENRIVISHPAYAIFTNEPMVIIEFGADNNPVYTEV